MSDRTSNLSPGLDGEKFLRLTRISKRFDHETVLEGIDLEIEPGEFFTLLGPSGCGKTTLLRIIGGLEKAEEGEVALEGRNLTDTPPERRPFNMVFQSYALFPHMSVGENVGYGLRASGLGQRDISVRVEEMLELVRLGSAVGRSVLELSGGQQQRVALARALINEPKILLLDEPLAALDLQLRKSLQAELRDIQRRTHTAFVYVTHDQEEALFLSDRIALMQAGQIVQVGSPRDLYDLPVNQFAATFIGETNLVECVLVALDHGSAEVQFSGGSKGKLAFSSDKPVPIGSRLLAMLRPEVLEITSPDIAQFKGVIEDSVFLGPYWRHEMRTNHGELLRFTTPSTSTSEIEGIGLRIKEGSGAAMVGGADAD
ncbi:MAG: ABC transporter ATP-binding protein [Thermoleophilia bacterium]|nr:ABC transporter ATP-binding protein [Thermoleophilia bacterium]